MQTTKLVLVLSTLHIVQDVRVLMEGKSNLWWGEGGPHRCVHDLNVLYLYLFTNANDKAGTSRRLQLEVTPTRK